jgi:uncharacterized CHY-type Zn-finger protein
VKNNGSRITIGSNGSKLSKFSREGAERSTVSFAHAPNPSRNQDLDLEGNWLCSHYKRRCYVKFECCDNFWPCHRCHNNQSMCGRKKLKSRDTQMVKCVYCNKVQQVTLILLRTTYLLNPRRIYPTFVSRTIGG